MAGVSAWMVGECWLPTAKNEDSDHQGKIIGDRVDNVAVSGATRHCREKICSVYFFSMGMRVHVMGRIAAISVGW